MAMQPLTSRARHVVDNRQSWWEKIYLPAVIGGLWVTFKHIFKRKVTWEYPEKERPRAPVYRGMHVLKRDEKGAERCTACGLCALACPAEAITMTAAERKRGEEPLYREEKYAAVYEINMLRCIFCGLCEEACPKEAIFLTDRLVLTHSLREHFVYGKERLVEPVEHPVDVTKRQTPAVLAFKKDPAPLHNRLSGSTPRAAHP
ncbi:MAG: NADH-quinone oxidoreductase subunit I [Spirochaetes bacterium]|nr:NADH-quinone oxidoreductase subunit I [Spirochaetota bacterium]